MNLVPFLEYMRYDGKFNLLSYLPDIHAVLDLEPKIHSSYYHGSSEEFGTTSLNLDVADTINIMSYSSGDSNEPGALWHIFKREDTNNIRKFILKNNKDKIINDPIHDQAFYFDEESLEDLANNHDIINYQIYQRPGDAVLIPAGCAHQIQNFHHCINISMNFLAPESASVYIQLANEFRSLPYNHSKCVDVLNTSSLLANVWNTMEEKVTGKSVLQGRIINYNLPKNLEPSDISKRNTSSSELENTELRKVKRNRQWGLIS